VIGSNAVRLSRYRKRFTRESSKTFHLFLTDASLLEGRIFNSYHLVSQDVRQICRINERQVYFPIKRNLLLRWRPCFAVAANRRSELPIDRPIESPRRRKVFQSE
jgi:hypothetical protein